MKMIRRLSVEFKEAPTAKEWGLYHPDLPEPARAARALNVMFVTMVNQGINRHDISFVMQELMGVYGDLGAADSEPYEFLEQLLEKTYDG